MQARGKQIELGENILNVPIFFPSISSVKTNLPPIEYLKLIIVLKSLCNQFLLSAFDLDFKDRERQNNFKRELERAKESGQLILIDSGNYESYWTRQQSSWTDREFHSVLQVFPYNFAFCFDNQNPSEKHSEHLKSLVKQFHRDQSIAGSKRLIPIIHGNPKALPQLSKDLARCTGTKMLAVPERKLGDGIFERIKTVEAIRISLNELDSYVGIHLLGTGNPISIALYAIAGADSFDGLEWCQTVVDYETALLCHFSHADFFREQSNWFDESIPFQAKTLAHNLEFYYNWMSQLTNSIHENKVIEFCRTHFPQRIFLQCASALEWEK